MVLVRSVSLLWLIFILISASVGFAQQTPIWHIAPKNAHGTVTFAIPSSPMPIMATGITTQGIITEAAQVRAATTDIAHSVLGIPKECQLLDGGNNSISITTDYTYQGTYHSIPIQDVFLKVTVGKINHSIIAIRNSIPSLSPNAITPSLSIEEILAINDQYLGTGAQITKSPQLVLTIDYAKSGLRLAYELCARDNDHGSWRMTFDALTGELIEKRSRLLYHKDPVLENKPVTIKATVRLLTPFDSLTQVPLPFLKLTTASNQTIVTDSNGIVITTLPSNVTASLQGLYCGVKRSDAASASVFTPLSNAAASFTFDDNNSNAAERNAYYSVNVARSFIHRLDPALTELNRYMRVNVNLASTCNAFYDPDSISLNFFSAGSGCSNTAEIADVVFHEFGHRVQHAVFTQDLLADSNIVNSAMGEGFSDVYSAFMRDDPRIGVTFFGNNSDLLRNCENTKQWPTDISGDPHVSGEIIAGAFWDLRKAIGLDVTTRLFQTMMHRHPDGADAFSSEGLMEAFLQTLNATILTDDDDNNLTNGTPHYKQIVEAFKLHNITLGSLLNITVEKLPDQDTTNKFYPVSISVSYQGIVGEVDTTAVRLFYSIDGGRTYVSIPTIHIGNSYRALIPPQLPGTNVYYFASAKLTIDADADAVTSPNPRYSFLIGYTRLVYDDCEINKGWSLSQPSDVIATGAWEFAKPYGTYTDISTPLHFIQQDTDHTPLGQLCYVTGNKNADVPTRSPGNDDVDGGATTLTTPEFHFANPVNPVIRYWYYYTNDMGSSPGISIWVVRMTVDGGLNWKTVTQTNQSTDGWTQASIEISAYIKPTNRAQLQFIASDNVRALVEAGVDDLETLDANLPSVNVRIKHGEYISLPYPNPISVGSILKFAGDNTKLELYDLTGKQVANAHSSSMLIPNSINAGVYVLKSISTKVEMFKIVVTK